MAKKMGWKVNEYGIFNEDGEDIAKESEEEFYKAFGFDFIEPELREDRGEFEASKNHKLPNLVEIDDLFGDLNLKSKFSGGVLGFKDILDESKKRGYKQIAIADLIKREEISAYLKSFDEIQRDSKDVEILRAIEVEIDCSGKVKIEDELLKEFDIVIAIIKDRCDLNRSMQTKRILKAIENRFITTIAHLRDRVIQKRDPMQIELGLVFEMIAKRGLAIEIDANPFRLDLDDISIKLAKEYGLKFSIGSHAKNREEFDFLRYGLYQARRGWLEKRDLLNCSMIRG
jgi:DNA polymerase (family 10)